MYGDKKVIEISLSDILPNRFQPRIKFNDAAIEELAESIREHGVIQPIIVRPIGDKYEIIAGERRYKASILANKKTIPAIVINLDDKESAEIAIIENVQRQDLTPIEEAISYRKILDMGYLTQETLAQKLGKTQPTIANKLRLLNLDEEVQDALLEGKISERHARSLLKLSNHKDQRYLLNRIINERLTVRQTDEEIKKMLNEGKNMDIKNENNDIEIIDFDNIEIVEEKKPEQVHTYNIPTSPIIDDKIEESFDVFVDERNNDNNIGGDFNIMDNFKIDETIPLFNNENNIPPGFMDIDRIENEAKDIFEEKPLIDLDSLLMKDQRMENDKTNETENINEEKIEDETIKYGKFFNQISEEDNDSTFRDTNYDNEMIDKTFDNTFESLFNINTNNEEKPRQVRSVDDYFSLNNRMYESPNTATKEIDKTKLKEAIRLVRDCTDKIKDLGFSVDTDEMDFENMYQIIFKIRKE